MESFEAKKTALVVIDLQKGLLGFPFAPHSADDVLARSTAIADAMREKGGTVVLVNVGWHADFGDAPQQPVDQPAQGAAPGPDWLEFGGTLHAPASDIVITKRQWGAFYGTELDLQLRRRGIDTILLTGYATNIGVESTARDAWEHGYKLVLVEDATASFASEMHQFPYGAIFPQIARVRSTEQILSSLA